MADTSEKPWAKPLKAKLQSRCPGCLSIIYEGQLIYLVEHRWICRDCYYAARRSGVC